MAIVSYSNDASTSNFITPSSSTQKKKKTSMDNEYIQEGEGELPNTPSSLQEPILSTQDMFLFVQKVESPLWRTWLNTHFYNSINVFFTMCHFITFKPLSNVSFFRQRWLPKCWWRSILDNPELGLFSNFVALGVMMMKLNVGICFKIHLLLFNHVHWGLACYSPP